MRKIGVPYPENYETMAATDLEDQAILITESLKKEGVEADPNIEIIALIAYLQRLGTDIKVGKNISPASINP